MNSKKIEEMAEDIASEVLFKYSEIEKANMPYTIGLEISKEVVKHILNLPEVKAMREALEFYANRNNWSYGCGNYCCDIYVSNCISSDDLDSDDFGGSTARKALQLAEEKD